MERQCSAVGSTASATAEGPLTPDECQKIEDTIDLARQNDRRLRPAAADVIEDLSDGYDAHGDKTRMPPAQWTYLRGIRERLAR